MKDTARNNALRCALKFLRCLQTLDGAALHTEDVEPDPNAPVTEHCIQSVNLSGSKNLNQRKQGKFESKQQIARGGFSVRVHKTKCHQSCCIDIRPSPGTQPKHTTNLRDGCEFDVKDDYAAMVFTSLVPHDAKLIAISSGLDGSPAPPPTSCKMLIHTFHRQAANLPFQWEGICSRTAERPLKKIQSLHHVGIKHDDTESDEILRRIKEDNSIKDWKLSWRGKDPEDPPCSNEGDRSGQYIYVVTFHDADSGDLLRYDDDGPTFAQLRSSRLRWACQESDPNHERTCVAATQIVCWSPSVTNGGAVQTRGTPSSRTTEAAVHATALQAMDDVSSTSTNEELRLESMSTSRGQSSSTRTAQGLARSREKGKRRRIDSPSPDTASSREPTAARENKKDLAIRQLIEAIRSNSLHARCTSQELSDKMTSVGFATLEQRRQTTGTQFGVSVDGSAGSTQDQLRLIAAKMGQLHARNSTSSGARRASKNMPWEMISRDCARLMRHLQRFETLEMTSTQRRHHTLSGIQAWFDAKKWYISLEDLRCRAQDITRVYAGKQRNLNMVFAILEVDPTKVGFEAVNGKTKVQYLCNLDHKSPGAVARSTYCLGPLVRFAAISRHLFGDTSLNVSGVYDPVPVFLVPYKKAYMETAGNAAPESLLPWPPSTSNTEASPSSGKSEHSPTQEEIHFFRVLLHLYHLSLVVRYASRQADVPKVLQWLLEDELFFLSENDVNWSTAAKRPRAYFKDVRLETCSHSSPPLPS